MKKIFITMMLAVSLIAGGTAVAQNKTEATTGATVQKENSKDGKKASKDKGAQKRMMQKVERPVFNPFDGVQLTDDQQQRLQALQQGLGPVQLTPEQQAKIKENPNLTKEQKQQLKQERKAKKLEAKKKYLNGVKEILTPDQYVVFLENCYIYSPQNQGKATKMKGYKNQDKKDKKAKKGKRDRKENKTKSI